MRSVRRRHAIEVVRARAERRLEEVVAERRQHAAQRVEHRLRAPVSGEAAEHARGRLVRRAGIDEERQRRERLAGALGELFVETAQHRVVGRGGGERLERFLESIARHAERLAQARNLGRMQVALGDLHAFERRDRRGAELRDVTPIRVARGRVAHRRAYAPSSMSGFQATSQRWPSGSWK